LTGPPTAALPAYLGVYLPWGGEGGDYHDAPPAAHGSRLRLEARSVPSMFDSLEVKVLCTTGWR
jgi:hypothetical protein